MPRLNIEVSDEKRTRIKVACAESKPPINITDFANKAFDSELDRMKSKPASGRKTASR